MRPVLVLASVVTLGCGVPNLDAMRAADIEGARTAFLGNLAAIQERDTEAYLSFYVESDEFVALSPAGLVLGYEPLASARRVTTEWPDSLAAGSPTLVWLAPGVVYGAYEYVVTQAGATATGWSERIFVKTSDGWKIAVTSAIPSAP